MAFTDDQEAKLLQIIDAYTNGKTIEGLPLLPNLSGGEQIELMKGGISYRATTAMLSASTPDATGVYPDVPLNRVTIKRLVGQLSPQVVLEDNLGLIDVFKSTVFPCTIDRNSHIVARLNGSDMTRTVDGLPAVLDDWTQPVMVRMGGIYYKEDYDASLNTKILHLSPYKVRGYKYIRRFFRGAFNGTVKTIDSVKYLCSNANEWTTQGVSVANFHTYAKNLGENFRNVATQDREVYRMYFWLMEKTNNSQDVLRGIVDANSTNWAAFSQEANGGQSTYGQFHKTGETLSILGHKGEKPILVEGFPNGDITVKPQKWLWVENGLSGPYFILETGYLKKDRVWYKVNDLRNIAFTITENYAPFCEDIEGESSGGYILENQGFSLIPTKIGGSSSTGLCDNYWRPNPQVTGTIYVPAGVANAYIGLGAGLSCLSSSSGVSGATASNGGALASEDPTDENG